MKIINWSVFFWLILMYVNPLHAHYKNEYYQSNEYKHETSDETNQILTGVINGPKSKIRNTIQLYQVLLGTPRRPEYLPQTIHPGNTLLRPGDMFKPLREFESAAMYGHLDDVSSESTRQHIRYMDFQEPNIFLNALQNLVHTNNKKRNPRLIVVEIDPSEIGAINLSENQENTGSEILDDLGEKFDEDSNESVDFRRRGSSSSGSSSRSSGSSSESEKNEGNPFTIHKDKYKQNWLWNFQMDGDHMNVNPFAPQLNMAGPTGEDLFFGRKWWYFNQDDYKPMGRRR